MAMVRRRVISSFKVGIRSFLQSTEYMGHHRPAARVRRHERFRRGRAVSALHQSGGSVAPCRAARDRSTVPGGSAPAFLFFFTPLSPAAAAAFRRATALKAALSAAISHRFSFSLAPKRKRNGGRESDLKKGNLQNFAIEQKPPVGKGKMAKARARPKRSIPSKTARQARFFLCSQMNAAQNPLTIKFTI